jgi:hypothetical protein
MDYEYRPVPPPSSKDETVQAYASRLEELGYDEMRIKKEILKYFKGFNLSSMRLFHNLSDARIRYVTMIHLATPDKPYKGLVKKLSSSVGVSQEDAEHSVRHFEENGGLQFVPWHAPFA